MADPSRRTALVTGATGYVGGLLVPRLLEQGWQVRVLTRSAARLQAPWRDRVTVVEGDAADADELGAALDGVDVAYYLIHAMGGEGDFVERDRQMATTFGQAARAAGVRRIVYLSGLHPEGELSAHLASRVEVGEVLMASGVPTAVLQAAVVLGDGSVSFQMLRYLTERLPAMVAPKWLTNRIQPIAVDDVMHYLVHAADLPPEVNRTFDIGGPDVLTYAEMMQRFARVTGLRKRLIVTVPVLTPRLASHWIGLVTPVDAGVAKPLVGSLVHEVVCREHDLEAMVPPLPDGPTPYDTAVRRAMEGVAPDTALRRVAQTGAAVTATSALGAWASDPGSAWYASLDKPAWQPPGVAFPVVWTALYADLAAVSALTLEELDRTDRPREARAYEIALAANLALNASWSWTFFRAHRPWLAVAHSAVLAASSADLTRRAARLSPKRGAALAAYPAWCGFATVLSTAIARRNG